MRKPREAGARREPEGARPTQTAARPTPLRLGEAEAQAVSRPASAGAAPSGPDLSLAPGAKPGAPQTAPDARPPGPPAPPKAAPNPASTPKVSANKPLLAGFAVLAVLVGGFGWWAATTNIAGAIIASGRIEVDSNRQVVQHVDGGVVDEVLVEEGDMVEEGDVLLRLDPTFVSAELAITEDRLWETSARRARLEAERDGDEEIEFDEELLAAATEDPEIADVVEGQRNLFDARAESAESTKEQLRRRRFQIASQIDGIDSQETALSTQAELIQTELTDQQSLLDRGLAQASRVSALMREDAQIEGQRGELAASRAEAAERITEIELELLAIDSTLREEAITELRDIRTEELELREQRVAQLAQQDRLVVRAPVGGIVYGMTVFGAASVIQAAEEVLYIVPQDRPLVIAARVQPINVDEVYPGQEARLRLSAFDANTTPELNGEVISVSADSFDDEQSGAAFYRTEIVLSEGERARLGEDQVLIPGMPVEAFIRTQDRTPLNYLVAPMMNYITKAFREG